MHLTLLNIFFSAVKLFININFVYFFGYLYGSKLSFIIFIPLIGSFIILLLPRRSIQRIKEIGLKVSGFNFLFSLYISTGFIKRLQIQEPELYYYKFPLTDTISTYCIGMDGMAILFVVLSNFLIFICLLASWSNIKIYVKEYVLCFLILSCFLNGAFLSLDVLFFYFFFEATLIPMYIIVLIWGSRERKVRAAYYLFLYTFFASMFMLGSILVLSHMCFSTNYIILILMSTRVPFDIAKYIWLGFFFSFATKLPLMPFHIWLPEAHVEAPTAGSVILAGILLKLGSFGMIRFLLTLFPTVSLFFLPLTYMLGICGVIYTSLTAIRQSDFKRIIAYSSVAHMSLVNLGIFSMHIVGISGAVLQSLSHGFVASALFLCIGVVYDRFHTRIIRYYSGLTFFMPLYAIIFLFFTMANIALPGTSSFVGELMLLAGCLHSNTFATFFGATGMILGGVYALWLSNRILFGNLKSENRFHCDIYLDISLQELYVFIPLILCTLALGIYPIPVLDIFKVNFMFIASGF